MSPTDRTGVLVLRVWVERAAPDQLRARIIEAHAILDGRQIVVTARGGEAILAAVNAWLDAFLADKPGP